MPASSSCSATCTTGSRWAARCVNLADYLEDSLLAGFAVVLSYDLGNGLSIERGGELVAKWQGAELKNLAREPLPAMQWIGRYLRYLGNLRTLGSKEKIPNVAVILRGVDQHVARGRHGLRARQHRQPAARLGERIALLRSRLHQPADRRQSQ